MDKQTFLNIITEIGTCEDDVARRTLLSELSDDVSTVFDDNATLTETNTQLTADNETLRDANTKLFLKIGESTTNPDKPPADKEPVKRKFENLFDDKGDLK